MIKQQGKGILVQAIAKCCGEIHNKAEYKVSRKYVIVPSSVVT